MANKKIEMTGKLKSHAFRLILGCISITFTLVGCNSKLGSTLTKNPATQAAATAEAPESITEKPKILITETEPWDSLPQEEKEKYEAPPQEIKIGEHVLKTGKLNFHTLGYQGDKKSVLIRGELSLVDVEGFSDDNRFKFELKGDVTEGDREIIIKAYDIDRRKGSKVRLGARVICRYDDNDVDINCDEAKIDFFVQVKELKMTKQFRTEKLKNKKANPPAKPDQVPAEPATPPANPSEQPPSVDPAAPGTPVVPEPEQPGSPAPTTPPETQPVVPVNPQNPAQPPSDDDDATVVGEGADQSLGGPFQTHINAKEEVDAILGGDSDDDDGEAKPKDKKPDVKPPQQPPKKPVIKNGVANGPDGNPRPVDQAIDYANEGRLRNATDLVLQQKQMKHENLYLLSLAETKKHYSTWEMAQLIFKLGEYTSKTFRSKLIVGNASLKNGGFAPPHSSHQNGTDADFGYPNDDNVLNPKVAIEEAIMENGKPVKDKAGNKMYRTISFNPKAFSAEKTLGLLEAAFKQQTAPIARVFMNEKIIDHLCDHAKKTGLIDFGSKDPKKVESTAFWKQVFGTIQHVVGHGNHMHIRIQCTKEHRDCEDRRYLVVNHCQK